LVRENEKTEMKASVEPITEVVRVWDDDAAEYGDHYEWFCGLRWLSFSAGEVELIGITKRITEDHWVAIMDEMQRKGVKRILSTSYPDGSSGKERKVWIDVPSPFQELWRI